MHSSGFYWKLPKGALRVVNPLQPPCLPRYGLLSTPQHLQKMDEAAPDEDASRCKVRCILQSIRHIPSQAQLNAFMAVPGI